MGRIFEDFQQVPDSRKEEIEFTKKNYFTLLLFLGALLLWGAGTIYLQTKKTMPIEKSVVETINMKEGNILTSKVKYETYKKIDPEDSGDIYFEIIKSNDESLSPGDLVKFNPRFIQNIQIENTIYCVLEASQIQFSIKKEDVKTSLLKR